MLDLDDGRDRCGETGETLMTPKQLIELLGIYCGEYGRSHNEPPDYTATWWFDGRFRPAEVAQQITEFFERKQNV